MGATDKHICLPTNSLGLFLKSSPAAANKILGEQGVAINE